MKDLVAKILSPTRPYKIKGRVYWVRQNIPYELQLKADLFCQELMGEFRFFGMLTRKQIKGLCPDFEPLEKEMRAAKYDLYKHYPDSFLMKPDRQRIKDITRTINEQAIEYSHIEKNTLEFYCEKRAAIFALEELTGEPYEICELIYQGQFYNNVSVSDIRKLARSDYWQNMVRAKSPFKYLPLTDEQIALSTYSNLYKNIYEHAECPTGDIIGDDDLLDGWLISQNKDNKKKKQTSYGNKIDSSKEIFVMAQGQEHANEIYEMNSEEARAIQQVRFKQMKKQGAVPFGKFADVQRERVVQQNNAVKR